VIIISSTIGVIVASGVTVLVATGVPVITGVVVTVPLATGVVVITTVEGFAAVGGEGVDWSASDGRAMVIMMAMIRLKAVPPAAAIQMKILIRILVLIIRTSITKPVSIFIYIYKRLQKVLH
jgi:hypothetical protein